MSMTIEQAKSELMQIYGALSPDKQRAIDTVVKIEPKTDVSEYDIDHIWYKGGQYISLRRFLEVKAEAEQEPKIGHCKDCKYFEYDSVARVDGIPLIVAHEICSRWGDGCKTKEGGYCFLFEPQESEDKE